MSQAKMHAIVRWFADCSDRYVRANLAHIDVHRLEADLHYGLKLFFFAWAFERSGAPRAYRIAAVKAVSSLKNSNEELSELFGKFCEGKIGVETESRFWKKGNIPVIDPKLVNFDVPVIVQRVKEGALREAFDKLELRGMRHKLKAFFLRDLVTLLEAEPKLNGDHDAYVWCQPIDVWIRLAASELCEGKAVVRVRGDCAKYQLGGDDLAAAINMIQLCRDAGVSPLRVNQGIWYFAANAVADERGYAN